MSEPTPEAIEAGAKAIFADEQCDRRQKLDIEANWHGRLDEHDHEEYRSLARAALSAASPYLIREAQAQALEDAAAWLAIPSQPGGGFAAEWLWTRAAAIRNGGA